METTTEFTKQITEAILASFPESRASVSMSQIVGEPFCYIQFTLGKDKSEYAHGYAENDNVHQRIMINGFDSEFKVKDKLRVESSSSSVYVKPTNRLYAYDKIKTGWRNFTATEPQVVNKIGIYFQNLKQLLVENFDKMTDDSQKLMIQKKYVNK